MRAFIALALVLWAGLYAATAGQGSEDARIYIWEIDDPAFGGFSGLHVFAGGERFLALSDRATMFEGRFIRDGSGAIKGIEAGAPQPLPDEKGDPIGGPRADSEGLAVATGGERYISFEGVSRLRIEDRGDGLPERLPRHPDFARLQSNSSLEALAIGPDGALYTIPERSGRASRPFPVYRLRGESWDIPFTIPREGAFLVSGADIGPDGRLYVLERDFTGIGFRSRVRRFALDGSGGEVLMESGTGAYDNLEGISVWRDEAGRLTMTMISDDNFRWFQQTQIVEIALSD